MSPRPKSNAHIKPAHDHDGYVVIDSDGDTCGRFEMGEEHDACMMLLSIADDERGMDDEHWEAEQIAVGQQAQDTKDANRAAHIVQD